MRVLPENTVLFLASLFNWILFFHRIEVNEIATYYMLA